MDSSFPLTDTQNTVINNYGLSLADTPEEKPITLQDDGSINPPLGKLADVRAAKAAYGTNGDQDNIQTQIATGREPQARQQASYDADLQWQQQRSAIIRKIVNDNEGKVTPDQLSVLQEMTKEDWITDPNTVFEKKFAQKFVRDQVTQNVAEAPTGMWAKAWKENPVAAAQNIRIFSDIQTKNQIAETIAHDSDDEASQRGILQTIGGFLWGATPGVAWWNQTRILKEAPWDATNLPGRVKREQISYLMRLPPEEMALKARQAYDQLKEVSFQQANEFAHALKGFSTSDEYLMSGSGILDMSLLPWGRVASRVGKLGGNFADRVAASTATTPPKPSPTTFIGGKETYATSSHIELPPIAEVVQDSAKQAQYTIQPNLFEHLETQAKPTGMEPGKLRATYKPLAQQDAEAEAASQRTGRNVTGRFEKGQGQYYQTELELDQPGVNAGFQKVGFKPQNETYLTKDGSVIDARTGQELTTSAEREKFRSGLSEGIDRMAAFTGHSKSIGKLTDDVMNAKSIDTVAAKGNTPAGIYGNMERVTNKWDSAPIKPVDMQPSYVNPRNYFGNGDALYNQRALAVKAAEALDTQWQQILDNTMRVGRLPPEAVRQAYEETKAKLFLNNAPRFGDGVLDVVHLPGELFKSNVGQAVMRLGDSRTKLPFGSIDQANLFAKDVYKLAPDEYRVYVAPKGDYYIGLRANVAENSDRTLNIFADLKNKVQTNLFTLGARMRMNDAWIPSEVMASRKVAEHAQQNLKEFITKEVTPMFRELGKDGARQVEQVINDFGNKRQWFKTADEFSEAFQQRFKVPPSEQQVEAAYRYHQVQDYDFMIRNAGMYRDMARQGAEQHSLMLAKGLSEPFNGIQLDRLPWGKTEDFTIALYKAGQEDAKVGFAHQAERAEGQLRKKELDDLINKGHRVIQIFDPAERPLQKMGLHDSYVNYVVTDAVDTKPLAWQQLKYDPGPHSIYPYEWYIKQPKLAEGHLGRLYYYGDNTLANFSSKAEADAWMSKYNTAREMVKVGDKGAEAYITKNLPYNSMKEFNELKNLFSMETPFAVTQRGYSVFETQDELAKLYPDAINFHKSTHNPQNFMDRTFLQERDQLLNNPVERNGILRFEPAKQLDAYEALDRGLSQSIRGMWLNDEKVGAITRWIENYHDVLSISHQKARDIPLWALHNGPFENIAKGAPLYEKLVAAKEERQAIINFLGQQTDWGNAVGRVQGALMDSIYKNLGKDAADFTANHSLSFLKDPARFFRAAAAHPTIGMFNPIPLVQQALTYFNVASIAPEHSIRALAASFLMDTTAHTGEDAILNRAAKIAENFGWKPEHFKEMNNAYRDSGLNIVGKEASMSAANFDNNLFRSVTGSVFKDKGFMFFNTGERLTRKAGFSASYAEWRAANPTAKLTEHDVAQIMQRGDTMTGHMTSASLSNFQQGNALASVAGQFSTYYIHMAQLMMGKELSVAEKARLFAVNSALYGVPSGLGIGGIGGAVGSAISSNLDVTTTPRDSFPDAGKIGKSILATGAGAIGLWNMYDDIMAYAKSHNIDISPGYAQVLLKGIPNYMFQIITGKDPDIAKNYALGQNGMLRDIVTKDKAYWQVMSGASGSVLGDIIDGPEPLLRKVWGTVSGDSNSDLGPIQASDITRALRVVKSLDWADRVYTAFALSKLETRKGVEMRGLDTMDAALTALRLSPKEYQDALLEINVGQAQKSIQDKYEKMYIENMRRYWNALKDGEPEKAEVYRRDARVNVEAGDFNVSDRARLFHRSIQESGDFVQNIDRRFMKKTPESLEIQRRLPQHFRTNP